MNLAITREVTDRQMCGYRLNWWEGFCWRDPNTRTMRLAVIPLNWILGWGRRFYYRLASGPRDRMAKSMEAQLSNEHSAGYKMGHEDGQVHGIEMERRRWQVIFDDQQNERVKSRLGR